MNATKKLVRIAICTAILAVSAWLTIPAAVPFTMQTMAVLTVSALLGPVQGCACVGVYLLLGAVGAPVFSGFRGGVSVLLGPTGGYLVGFLLSALLTGSATKRYGAGWVMILAMVGAIAVCHAFGTAWYALLFANGGVGTILMTCVVPFLLPDGAKIALAALLVRRIEKSGVLRGAS